MATDQPTDTHTVRKLSQHEVEALADRLFNRSISLFALDTFQEMRNDALLAVACLRILARDMPDDALIVRVWKGERP
jgi:hypothetical protein